MSNTTITAYMASNPKRPNLMKKLDQVLKFVNFMDHLIGGIRAGIIAAISTVSPGFLISSTFTPPSFINKPGKFTMIKINVVSIHDFPHFKG